MSHAAARRSGNSGDEADDRLFDVLLNELRGFFFRITADLTDHDNGLGLRILFEQRQDIDKPGAVHWIAANADAGGFAQAERRQLMDRFIGEGAAAGDDADDPLLVDKARHDADFRFIDRDDTRTIRTDQTYIAATERPLHLHHVVHGNTFS